MFYTFFFMFVTYIFSLLLFPFYKFYITSRLYIYINTIFLGCLLAINTFLAYSILVLQTKFLVTFELNNFLNNIVDCSFTVSLTPLSFFFSYLVVIIGFTTNIYTLNYFKGEADESIFVFWLNAFIASMLTLVLANSFYSLFLGWELIGLTSFFLINFWQTRRSTLKSSFKAFSFNLVSDIFLLAAFVCFYKTTNTTDCDTFIYLTLWDNLLINSQTQVGLLFLIICASIKSVQIGGHLWLPDSMEAPVPASSLIHSATLVSAGIFLLCKFSCLFIALNWTSFLVLLGSITAAYGALVSSTQTDLKKLLAYSTMSHCGFLWVLASSGNFFITIFYLFLHGLFKASSFYCAGSFIRNYGTQDSRLMGSSHIFFRLDTILFLICSANLGGLPFTFGYFFKSFFLKFIFLSAINIVSISFLLIGLLLSLLYFFRLTFYVIFDFYKNYKQLSISALQLVTINTSSLLRLTSLPHILAVSILLFFSVFFIIFFNSYYTDSIILIDSFDLSGLTFALINLTVLYKTYYLYFYFAYILLASTLLLVSYRKSLFNIETTLALFFIFFFIFFFIKMWGYIITEASTITNFNFGFMTYKSDILIHLSQWQYWWWFWFSLFWVMYFFVILRILHKRTFQYNPLINTSIRGHGKWGDFLVAIIPLSWCGNILVNSNFILRMIEWQNESSLFTLRVQGKQWYWVYKFDSTAVTSILAAPKNIGNNKWFVTTPQESYCFDNYYQALHLGAQLESKEIYLKELKKVDLTTNIVNAQNFASNFLATPYSELTYDFHKSTKPKILVNFTDNPTAVEELYSFDIYNIPAIDNQTNFTGSLLTSSKRKPLSFIRGVLNKHNLEILQNSDSTLAKPIFFIAKFWSNDGFLENKDTHDLLQWGFKQKRYKRLDKFQFTPRLYYSKKFLYNDDTVATYKSKIDSFNITDAGLIDNKNVISNKFSIGGLCTLENSLSDYHNAVKFNRHRGELVPTNLARRLLRTKRTLVLPAHVNITVVTNSYDVVHSWFIPGLGLKLDCVPGRSTHHSFYIDNIGFYYGQCAEICGRYHHHMPIRLCALPFEQFLVWWQKKGIHRIHRIKLLNSKSTINTNDIKFKYRW